jgi:hypothetical protein
MEHRVSPRRLVRSRLGLALVAGVPALLAAFLLGSRLFGGLIGWLHAQPPYQTTFSAIELQPPPPRWYHGGTAVFLDRVRRSAQSGEGPFSMLDADLAELLREFRLYCWVKRAVRAQRAYPNRILIHLEYRTPVARAFLPGRPGCVLVDESGVILPYEDVEEATARRLIRLERMEAPTEVRPGQTWQTEATAEGLGTPNPTVQAAAQLAAWLTTTVDSEPGDVPPALRPMAIHPCEVRLAFFIENAQRTMIYWPPVPAHAAQGPHIAQQRWADLHDWFKRRGPDSPPVQRPWYLNFTPAGVEIKKEGVASRGNPP